jgi:hypothetical protein
VLVEMVYRPFDDRKAQKIPVEFFNASQVCSHERLTVDASDHHLIHVFTSIVDAAPMPKLGAGLFVGRHKRLATFLVNT